MRTTSILRMAQLPPTPRGVPPAPFHPLADRLTDEDRRIVAMLLLRAHRDEVAWVCDRCGAGIG
jgi:hypothetical protein